MVDGNWEYVHGLCADVGHGCSSGDGATDGRGSPRLDHAAQTTANTTIAATSGKMGIRLKMLPPDDCKQAKSEGGMEKRARPRAIRIRKVVPHQRVQCHGRR